jgi:hypothetical protein
MCAVTVYVNARLHHHYGRSAKRNPASQALIAAYLLRERAVGIDTIVKAAVAPGTTRTAVHAALIVLRAQVCHLVELLAALRGDSVRLSVADPNSAILITDPDDDNFTAIQMPVRSP